MTLLRTLGRKAWGYLLLGTVVFAVGMWVSYLRARAARASVELAREKRRRVEEAVTVAAAVSQETTARVIEAEDRLHHAERELEEWRMRHEAVQATAERLLTPEALDARADRLGV